MSLGRVASKGKDQEKKSSASIGFAVLSLLPYEYLTSPSEIHVYFCSYLRLPVESHAK